MKGDTRIKAAMRGKPGWSAARFIRTLSLLAITIPGMAAADEGNEDGFRFEARIAGGPALVPEFEGSSRYELVPYFEAQVFYGPYHLRMNGPNARVNVVPHSLINAGPLISYQRGRNNLDTAQVDMLDRIRPALELGGFVEYAHRHDDDPLAVERLRLSVRQDVTGNHGGAVATLRGIFQRRVLRGTVFALTANVTWASHDFMDTFFSVSPPEAARSGLAPFDAGSGLRNIGAGMAFDQFLSRTWSVGARFNYTRLMGDAADSPIVETAGSPDQAFVTMVVGYRF